MSLTSSPKFEKQHKSPTTDFTSFISWFSTGSIDFDGEQPDDAG